MKDEYRGAPATIADLHRIGLSAIEVICSTPDCWHEASIPFKRLAVPDSTYVVELPKLRRFRCEHCGARNVRIVPDWSTYVAAGRPALFAHR